MKQILLSIFKRLAFVLIVLVLSAAAPPPTTPSTDDRVVVAADAPCSAAVCREDLTALSELYPDLIKIGTIGRSVYEQDIPLVVIGSGPCKILAVGSTHAREWVTSFLLLKALEEYAKAARQGELIGGCDVKALLAKATFLIVPMLDPDGVDISIQGLDAARDTKFMLQANLGRKDFSSWKANARGVNLNMQFRANWDKAISLSRPHFEKYKGPAPESEPESKALADFIRKEKPDAVVAYHATGRVIFWYYGQDGAAYRRDQALAKELGRVTGYRPAVENQYNRHGGLKDWFIHVYGRPAFTIEVGDNAVGCPVPLTAFPAIWRENAAVLLRLAVCLD